MGIGHVYARARSDVNEQRTGLDGNACDNFCSVASFHCTQRLSVQFSSFVRRATTQPRNKKYMRCERYYSMAYGNWICFSLGRSQAADETGKKKHKTKKSCYMNFRRSQNEQMRLSALVIVCCLFRIFLFCYVHFWLLLLVAVIRRANFEFQYHLWTFYTFIVFTFFILIPPLFCLLYGIRTGRYTSY